MPKKPDLFREIPLMFQAQTAERCQLHLIKKHEKPQAQTWTEQWVSHLHPAPPNFPPQVQTRKYTINWRLITNSGQDETIIRPVISAQGFPFYPGSSMKGAFLRACQKYFRGDNEKIQHYCGSPEQPGVLRFHGGFPINENWQNNLVDIVHPQQDKQVKSNKTIGAFPQISLFQPELKFGISSSAPDKTNWDEVWKIWEQALAQGIGCRVSAGYGQINNCDGDVIYRAHLQGQGAASLLLNKSGEFRPNIFKASLRGHALRIFGGLNQQEAEKIVNQLFGSVGNSAQYGLIRMNFVTQKLNINTFQTERYDAVPTFQPKRYTAVPTFQVTGELKWQLTKKLISHERQILQELIQLLTEFAMLLGGFGKSWRRADHRLFMPDYKKHLIGCHWQWIGESLTNNPVNNINKVAKLINRLIEVAANWAKLQNPNFQQKYNHNFHWREVWHSTNVQVWGRKTRHRESLAIEWFHSPYTHIQKHKIHNEIRENNFINKTSLTGGVINGKMQTGRIWHRMYPINHQESLELLTIFSGDNNKITQDFLHFLNHEQHDFIKLWPHG